MNATPKCLRFLSASLFAAVSLSACTGDFADTQERAELAAAIVEAEQPEVNVDVDALACAIDAAQFEHGDASPSFDLPPLEPCPPPVVIGVAPAAAADSAALELGAHAAASEDDDGLGTVPQPPSSFDDGQGDDGRGPKLGVIEPLTHAPLSVDPLTAAPIDHRMAELGTVPQGPISIDRPQVRPDPVELAMVELGTVPQGPISIDRPQIRPSSSELELAACMDACVQSYIVCAAHPDEDMLDCADALSACSIGC